MSEEQKNRKTAVYYATAKDYERMGHYQVGTLHRASNLISHRGIVPDETSPREQCFLIPFRASPSPESKVKEKRNDTLRNSS